MDALQIKYSINSSLDAMEDRQKILETNLEKWTMKNRDYHHTDYRRHESHWLIDLMLIAFCIGAIVLGLDFAMSAWR